MRSFLSCLSPILALAAAALPGMAAGQACGDTLTTSVTLAADLHCTTGYTAFEVGASGITIHLNGKTLSGTHALSGLNINGADNVRIVGPGRISGFWAGANVFRSPKLRVENVTFEDLGAGVLLSRSYGSRVHGSRFYRILNQAVGIYDNAPGSSLPSGDNRITGNQFGKVDIAIGTCGVTTGGNLIEGNVIGAAYSAGIRLADHSGGNYVSGNRLHNAYLTGISIGASRGNTVIDNQIEHSEVGIEIAARLDGRCVLDPALASDNGDHKVYDNRIVDTAAAVMVGNNPYTGKVFHIAFGGNTIDTAAFGFMFDVNTVNNHVFGSTWTAVGTPVLDLGYGNTW